MYTKGRAGFDVTGDPGVRDRHVASGTHVDGEGVNPDDVKNGVPC